MKPMPALMPLTVSNISTITPSISQCSQRRLRSCWRIARNAAPPIRNRPLKTTPQALLQMPAIVLDTPPKYFSVTSGKSCSNRPIRPVRATSTNPPTQNNSATSNPTNCQPLA